MNRFCRQRLMVLFRQQQGDFINNLAYGELKKLSNFNRKIYLNFDFSNISIDVKTAKLQFFVSRSTNTVSQPYRFIVYPDIKPMG